MTLNSLTTDKLPITPLYLATIKKSVTTQQPENAANIDFFNVASISEFFQNYNCIKAIYESNIHKRSSKFFNLYSCLHNETRLEQISNIQSVLQDAKNIINNNPILALEKIDIWIGDICTILKNDAYHYELKHKTKDRSADALLEILIPMTAEIQNIKNDINRIQENISSSSPRCKASPIYIKS